ncbi:tRNA dimethylallyltransferase [Candidatus Saccharibacteria bacterium]|nr:tRNA dimethylallyltransferase [Candidatus Saccharibacteria bacterium]
MAATTQRPKLLAIVGPTASGKSALALKVAQEYNGEIITADSLTIYKKMDIGTAKPTAAEQKQVPHWGLNIVGPRQRFTAAEFKRYAEDRIKNIKDRGNLPILAGGTGLYIDAVLFDFNFPPVPTGYDPGMRAKLEKLSIDQLQRIVHDKGYPMPRNEKNRRHLVGIIERGGRSGSKTSAMPRDVLVVGILPDNEVLKRRIDQRVEKMFKAGLVRETKGLLEQYGREAIIAKTKVAYGPVIEYLSGSVSLAEAKQRLKTAHWQYARRQRTWFKRNPHIKWFDSSEVVAEFIRTFLDGRTK